MGNCKKFHEPHKMTLLMSLSNFNSFGSPCINRNCKAASRNGLYSFVCTVDSFTSFRSHQELHVLKTSVAERYKFVT